MNEEYRAALATGVERRYRQLENDIMDDVVRRIKKAKRITETADWQIQRLEILGHSANDIRALVTKATDGIVEDVVKMYAAVVETEYGSQREIYKRVGSEFIPFEENKQLQQLMSGLIKQSTEELYNITKSMGFMVPMNGGNVFTPLADIYNDYLDQAIMGMASGAFDYNTVIRKAVRMMTNSGLRTDHNFAENPGDDYGVDYPSGWHNRLPVAARRAVLTGMSQLTGEIVKENAKNLGTDRYEVSWHLGARPTHQTWQGKVYTMSELESVCGYGTGAGLLGWNCRHMFYPFIQGVSERTYTDEWLEQQNAIENTKKTWKDHEYTTYELTQKQRQMETRMRAQRQKVRLMQEGGADKDDITIEKCKYQAQLDEYKEFCKKFGFKEQRERIYYDLKGRVAPSKATYEKYLAGYFKRKVSSEKSQYDEYIKSLQGGSVTLRSRQQKLLDKIPETKTWVEVRKKEVNLKDLRALTAKTGDEFAIFTGKHSKILFHGTSGSWFIPEDLWKEIQDNRYIWEGHSHPTTTNIKASADDVRTLSNFTWQDKSYIIDLSGKTKSFTASWQDWFNDILGVK